MKATTSIKLATAAIIAMVALAPSAKAQSFDSITAVGGGDTDVIDTGTTVLAYDVADFSPPFPDTPTVNGVTFSGDLTQNGVTLTVTDIASGPVSGVNGTFLSTNYAGILSEEQYGSGSSGGKLELSGLTAGDEYALQIFAGVASSVTSQAGSQEKVTDNANGASSSLPFGSGITGAYFITDTFTASISGDETLTLVPQIHSFIGFSAVNLRNLTAVPEPSTTALMLFGGLAIFVVSYRRRLAALKV